MQVTWGFCLNQINMLLSSTTGRRQRVSDFTVIDRFVEFRAPIWKLRRCQFPAAPKVTSHLFAHKFVGKYLGWVAVVNAVGMLQLAACDIVSPMVTERPPVFTPFMFMTAIIVFGCLWMSWQGLRAAPMNIYQHTLWMCRAFLMSFTTPVIRFYPVALRCVFSTACVKAQESLDTWVIGSMTVASTLTLYLFWLANKACLDEPVDSFLKGFLAFEIGCLLIDMQQHLAKGSFFGHMCQCFKDGENGPTIFDGMPAHPLAIIAFVIAMTVWIFFLLMDGETPTEEDEDTANEKTGLIR